MALFTPNQHSKGLFHPRKDLKRHPRLEEAVGSSSKAPGKLTPPQTVLQCVHSDMLSYKPDRCVPITANVRTPRGLLWNLGKRKQIKKFIKRFRPDQHLMAFPFSFTQERPRKGSFWAKKKSFRPQTLKIHFWPFFTPHELPTCTSREFA